MSSVVVVIRGVYLGFDKDLMIMIEFSRSCQPVYSNFSYTQPKKAEAECYLVGLGVAYSWRRVF